MFRKPKVKGNTRQRVICDDHEKDEDVEGVQGRMSVVEVSKPKAIVSFDDDEGNRRLHEQIHCIHLGADDNFEIKKSKRYQKEQRRQKRLEERAAREIKEEEDSVEHNVEQVIYIKQEVAEEKPVSFIFSST